MSVSIRATRALAVLIVAIFLASAVPYAASVEPAVDNAAAAGPYVRVGYMQDIANWNPLNLELVSDYMVCYLMFSVLFQFDENWEGPINDLATGYTQTIWPAGNMTTYIDITDSAYFRNFADMSSTAHPLKASDVAYTINLVLDHPGGAWDIYMKDVTGANATGEYQVAVDTAYPKATIIDDLAWVPILPEFQWSTLPSSQILGGKKPEWLMGSGPFVYESQSKGVWYNFKKALNYHGTADYGEARDVDIEGITYTMYTDAQGLALALNDGTEDVIDISGQPNLFLNTVGDGSLYPIVKAVTDEMAIIDIAINAIPEDFTSQTYGLGNPILRDPTVRKAIGMTLDRDFIANSLMLGMPMIADSVISDTGGQTYWHKDIENFLPFDPASARTMLIDAGYQNLDGDTYLECTAGSMAVLEGWADVGDELSFRLEVPDTDPSYATIGENWVNNATDAGIRFLYAARSESIMINSAWYKADYDIWVWSWYWGPEPIGTMSVWETSQIKGGGDNCQMPMGPWWYGPNNQTLSPTGEPYSAYDENLSLARSTLDRAARKVIIDQLQQWVYDSYCELPPIYPNGLYAWHEFRFIGWGDWETHLGRSISSDLPWLWFDLEWKGGNQAPSFVSPPPDPIQAEVNKVLTVSVVVSDPEGDPIHYSFEWGDGTADDTGDETVGTQAGVTITKVHTYTSLVLPPDYLMLNVTIWDDTAGNIAIARSMVNVLPEPDSVPLQTYPVISDPVDRSYVDQQSMWSAGFSDAESGGDIGTGLRFTWDWDDGTYNTTLHQPTTNSSEVMDIVWHAWTVEGSYSVTLYVDDGSGLPGHNVSVVIPYDVVVNQPPEAPAISPITGNRNVPVTCWATTSDADGDALTFTWNFGDGNIAVTESPAGVPGALVSSSPTHTWDTANLYTVTVYVEDSDGHNVSSTTTADIGGPAEDMPPGSLALIATPNPAYPDADVVFNASAVDSLGDPLTLYLDFGDGMGAVANTAGGTSERQYADPEFVHTYTDVGDYTATLWADDGSAGNVSLSITVSVEENEEPWLIMPSLASAFYNKTFVLTPARVRDNDTADVLSVWYDWGDGSWSMSGDAPVYNGTHVYNTTGNVTITVYVDDNTGLTGHNISGNVTITILENLRPGFVGGAVVTPDLDLYKPGDTLMFKVVVSDTEGDMLNITFDWGDGTTPDVIANIPGAPDANITKFMNHTFEKGRTDAYIVNITVDDGQMQYHSVKHWVSSFVSIKVEKEKGISTLVIVGIALAVIAAIALIVFLLMRKKKGEPKAEGGMEGMAPPEPPPPTT